MTLKEASLIGLVGDVMIENHSVSELLKESDGFRKALADLNSAEIRFINLEMPLSNNGYRVPKHTNLRSRPEVIEEVKALGTHAAALANNHMMDYGPEAMLDTLAACSRADIATTGAGADIDEALTPVLVQSGEHTIGLLSVSSTLPIESAAGPGKPGIAPIGVGFSFEVDTNLTVEQPGTMPIVHSWANAEDTDRVTDEIRKLKDQVDIVVVALHWGVPSYWMSPYQGLLAEYQQPLGRALVDAGADIIWGHHSHSLHPIEVYKGKPIFYSLGNFIFEEPRSFMESDSAIVHVTSINPLEIALTPIQIDNVGFPQVAEGTEAIAFASRLEELSRDFGTRFELQGNRMRLSLDDRR